MYFVLHFHQSLVKGYHPEKTQIPRLFKLFLPADYMSSHSLRAAVMQRDMDVGCWGESTLGVSVYENGEGIQRNTEKH